MSLPAGGLAAYAQRARDDHQRLSDGRCSCDKPLCPERYLLDHIDNLISAYELKVQDFAAETRRSGDLADRLAEAERERDQLLRFTDWLVSLDDPVNLEQRRRVSLNDVIARAASVAADGSDGGGS